LRRPARLKSLGFLWKLKWSKGPDGFGFGGALRAAIAASVTLLGLKLPVGENVGEENSGISGLGRDMVEGEYTDIAGYRLVEIVGWRLGRRARGGFLVFMLAGNALLMIPGMLLGATPHAASPVSHFRARVVKL